jgi:hypothetical protein
VGLRRTCRICRCRMSHPLRSLDPPDRCLINIHSKPRFHFAEAWCFFSSVALLYYLQYCCDLKTARADLPGLHVVSECLQVLVQPDLYSAV